MARSFSDLRVRLIQVRSRLEIIEEEQDSFLARTRLDRDQLLITNALSDTLTPALLDEVDAILIGGAGAYSVTHTYDWTDALISVCHACADRAMPLFGSCWGHQFIGRAFGGVVINDPERDEMGTHAVALTEAGIADPLFAPFPRTFLAQMGHQDRISKLPDGAIELARNDRAPYQAFRLGDLPIYGTQFHSELDEAGERSRLYAYRSHYPEMADDAVFQAAVDALRPTPDVDDLMYHFLNEFAVNP